MTIFDARLAARPGARQRKLQADWKKTHEEQTRRNTRGIAFVLESALVRGADRDPVDAASSSTAHRHQLN